MNIGQETIKRAKVMKTWFPLQLIQQLININFQDNSNNDNYPRKTRQDRCKTGTRQDCANSTRQRKCGMTEDNKGFRIRWNECNIIHPTYQQRYLTWPANCNKSVEADWEKMSKVQRQKVIHLAFLQHKQNHLELSLVW